MTEPIEHMMKGFTARLVEWLQESKKLADRTDDTFQRGRGSGFFMALTALVVRANAAGIDPRSIGLEGINPDDLI